jgi:hypothetical protein
MCCVKKKHIALLSFLTFPSLLQFFILFGSGFEVLTVVRINSGLGHRIVSHMVMNVLEEHSNCIFTSHQKMEAVCPDQILCAHQSDNTVP